MNVWRPGRGHANASLFDLDDTPVVAGSRERFLAANKSHEGLARL